VLNGLSEKEERRRGKGIKAAFFKGNGFSLFFYPLLLSPVYLASSLFFGLIKMGVKKGEGNREGGSLGSTFGERAVNPKS
jgi:hypothetical protein|tara:strand:+ start:326 stop:565 length:240 start_codon:yes stop_codon:yes gene_type:complete